MRLSTLDNAHWHVLGNYFQYARFLAPLGAQNFKLMFINAKSQRFLVVMEIKAKSDWATKYEKKWVRFNSYLSKSTYTFTMTVPSKKYIATQAALTLTGTALGLGAGLAAGVVIDHIPLLNQALPTIVQDISNIDVHNKIPELFEIFGGFAGLLRSRISLDEEAEPKQLVIWPIHFEFKNKKKVSVN